MSTQKTTTKAAVAPEAPQVIWLYRGHNAWIADRSNTDEAPELYRLFGTSHIPTAFTLLAHEDDVRAEIAKLNPGVKVIVEKGWAR